MPWSREWGFFKYLQASQRALPPAAQRARKSPYACSDFNVHPSRFMIVRWSWVCRQEPWFKVCVCVWTQNGLPVQTGNGCQGGESKLFAHVQTCRMDEDTDGISLWEDFSSELASLCLERHGNLGWNGQASYWMREDLGLSPKMVWMGNGRQAAKVLCVGVGGRFVEMRSV